MMIMIKEMFDIEDVKPPIMFHIIDDSRQDKPAN